MMIPVVPAKAGIQLLFLSSPWHRGLGPGFRRDDGRSVGMMGFFNPPRHGEGDHAQHGGGGGRRPLASLAPLHRLRRSPSPCRGGTLG